MSNVRLRVMLFGALALGMLALTACSSSEESATTTPSTSSSVRETTAVPVDTTVNEWSITTTPVEVRPGEVKFVVNNAGEVVHELVVVKTDLAPDKLPTLSASDTLPEGHAIGDVNEEALDSPGEIEDIDPSGTKDATFRLTPGNYVLICNLAGHYARGMRVAFTVK